MGDVAQLGCISGRVVQLTVQQMSVRDAEPIKRRGAVHSGGHGLGTWSSFPFRVLSFFFLLFRGSDPEGSPRRDIRRNAGVKGDGP